MKFALASKEFIDNDIKSNLRVILSSMKEASKLKCDFILLGESFLQGIECLNWKYKHDEKIGIEYAKSKVIQTITIASKKLNIGIMFGYIEKCNKILYSSYLMINNNGKVIGNYRRISVGWKSRWKINYKTLQYYQEGDVVPEFKIGKMKFRVALCGDLFDYPAKFKRSNLLLWPLYTDNYIESKKGMPQYKYLAKTHAKNVLIINSVNKADKSNGGAYYMKNGRIVAKVLGDKLLIVDLK